MIDNVERSPETIHYYFDLLKWYRAGGTVELPPELIETSELLLPINRELLSNRESISSIEQSIVSDGNSINLIINSLSSVNQIIVLFDKEIESIRRDIESVRRDIESVRRNIEAVRRDIEAVRNVWSSNRVSLHSLIIPQLSLQELCTRLLRAIVADFKSIILVLVQCLKRQPIITLSVGTIIIVVGLLFGIIFPDLSNLIIIVLIFAYLIKKIKDIYKAHENIERQKFVNLEKIRLQNQKINLQSNEQELEADRQDLEARQQELEAERQELEPERQELEAERQDLEAERQELEAGIETSEQELTELKRIYEQKLETRQNEFDKLKDQERESKEALLRDLEEKVKEWLAQDKITLLKRASNILVIEPDRESGELNTIQVSQPIQRLFGVSSWNVKRRQNWIETDRDNNLLYQDEHFKGLLIEKRDFRVDDCLDRKKIYGVYEFNVIFICANFLGYYKCYWNFIRGLPVDEEICEILYDTIVSVKVKGRSSARQKDQAIERIYRYFLSITTMDGKIISFRIDEDRKKRIATEGSWRESQIEEAGRIIRDILRQRRIDVMRTKNADS
jgi:peptidoglycan hydrolase CwlO-like protein